MHKDELMKLAQTAEIEGRSSMDKPALVDALTAYYAAETTLPGATAGTTAGAAADKPTNDPAPDSKEAKADGERVGNTNPTRTANENVEEGGHPTGRVPGGTS